MNKEKDSLPIEEIPQNWYDYTHHFNNTNYKYAKVEISFNSITNISKQSFVTTTSEILTLKADDGIEQTNSVSLDDEMKAFTQDTALPCMQVAENMELVRGSYDKSLPAIECLKAKFSSVTLIGKSTQSVSSELQAIDQVVPMNQSDCIDVVKLQSTQEKAYLAIEAEKKTIIKRMTDMKKKNFLKQHQVEKAQNELKSKKLLEQQIQKQVLKKRMKEIEKNNLLKREEIAKTKICIARQKEKETLNKRE